MKNWTRSDGPRKSLIKIIEENEDIEERSDRRAKCSGSNTPLGTAFFLADGVSLTVSGTLLTVIENSFKCAFFDFCH